MSRNPKCVTLAVLLGLAGCVADQSPIQFFTMSVIEMWCQNAAATTVVPTAVPVELDVIRADPATFCPAPHPLADVVVGTRLDDLSGLAGCWGRYTCQTFEDAQSGQSVVSEEFAVLEFDPKGGTVTLHRYSTIPSVDPNSDRGQVSQVMSPVIPFGSPVFLTEVYSIKSMTDDFMVLQGVRAEGAAVAEDGLPVFTCLAALSSSVNARATLNMLITLQGDYLKEYDAAVDPNTTTSAEDLIPAEADEYAYLWVRFDCSAD